MLPIPPNHPEIEAVWQAVTSAGARSVAVVAPDTNQGATLLAIALARRAGLSGGNALLVETNTGRPSVARLMGVEGSPCEVYRARDGIGVLWADGCDACGTWRDPSRLSEALEDWKKEWEIVIFDTAPLLSKTGEAISGTAVASVADATIMVIKAGPTPANRVVEARTLLARSGATLLGCVLNDFENPTLLEDLERQTHKLDRFAFRTMERVRQRLRASSLLGVRI